MTAEPRLLAGRVLDQQVRHLTDLLSRASDRIEDPAPGTPAADDLHHVNNQPQKENLLGLRWWAQRAATLNLVSAAEHQAGLRLIVTGDELLPLPAMALGRSIYEAILNTCWLLDPAVTTEQRLARWAGRLLHDSEEPPNALDSFGDADASTSEMGHLVEGRHLGQQLMRRAGFELTAKGGDKSEETRQVRYRGERATLTPNVTRLVPRFTPNQQSLWPLFSGAAHSRGWLVAGLQGNATLLLTSILTPLLDASDALAIETGSYFGIDPRPLLRKTHLHRRVLLRQARPRDAMVANWETYRAAGGAPPVPPLPRPADVAT